MRTMLKLILVTFLLTLTFSCGTPKKKSTKKGPRVYGQEVEDEFRSIETGANKRGDVLEYYRRLRQENWNDYKKDSSPSYSWKGSRRKKAPNRIIQRPAPQTAPKKLAPIPRTPKPLAASIVKEMKIEISQYMSYYCMENRKSSRFSGSADCSAYTENILRECENKYPVISDRSLVKCVRSRLR